MASEVRTINMITEINLVINNNLLPFFLLFIFSLMQPVERLVVCVNRAEEAVCDAVWEGSVGGFSVEESLPCNYSFCTVRHLFAVCLFHFAGKRWIKGATNTSNVQLEVSSALRLHGPSK